MDVEGTIISKAIIFVHKQAPIDVIEEANWVDMIIDKVTHWKGLSGLMSIANMMDRMLVIPVQNSSW